MPVVSHEALKTLAALHGAACVSIFLPTHRANPEAQQDPIRLKNMLAEAEKRLAANGLRGADARRLVAQADILLPRHNFAQPGSAGLAVFLAPDFFAHFWLPFALEERLVIGHRFHLKPLLPSLAPDGVFYVLALSQNQVRLLEGTRHSVREVELAGVPQSLAAATAGEEGESLPQYRSSPRGPGSHSGQQPGVFHGTANAGDENRNALLRFFHQVDEGVRAWLGPSAAPLVLAGVEYLHPLYREANEYPHLLEAGLKENPQDTRPEDLHAAAWELVRPLITAGRAAAAEVFRELHGAANPLASTNLDEIVPAAHFSRVDTLFVTLGARAWGRFDPETSTVTRLGEGAPEADDLYDLAAVQTYLNGGSVYAVTPDKMPVAAEAAAVFRY
jgi:hypothetical protein